MINVPNLSLAVVRADRQVISFVAPADARYLVVSDYFAQFLHLGSARAPNVDCFVEAHSQHVRGTPVN